MTNAAVEHHLIRLFLAAGHGSALEAEVALRAAVEAGVPPSLIEESLLLLIPYGGVPRALLAFGILRRMLPTLSAAVIGRPDPTGLRGKQAFEAVYANSTETVTILLNNLHPDLAAAAVEDAYGRVLARESFPWRTKEVLAVAFLVALGAEPQAQAHARAALRHGASQNSIQLALELGMARLDEAAQRGAMIAIAAALRTRTDS